MHWNDRQRKPNDGQKKGPEGLGEILSRLFTSRGWGRKSERLRLEEAWAAAAGPEYAGKTRVAAMRRGVLEIEVAPGALLQELASFHKRRLLEAMKREMPSAVFKDIRFRAGLM
ncbi:MAG: DUF721 domain-containing protein [Gemmataceae bacterium]